jgi:hypothetical protein
LSRCGLDEAGRLNLNLKIRGLVAGMVAGADSIEEMALLRHGGMARLIDGVRAPSTLGTFLRTFTFGHVRQLDAAASRLLINLTWQAPLLPGADDLADLDLDTDGRSVAHYLPPIRSWSSLRIRPRGGVGRLGAGEAEDDWSAPGASAAGFARSISLAERGGPPESRGARRAGAACACRCASLCACLVRDVTGPPGSGDAA